MLTSCSNLGGMFITFAQRLKELQTMLGALGGPDKDGIKERFCKAPAKPAEGGEAPTNA